LKYVPNTCRTMLGASTSQQFSLLCFLGWLLCLSAHVTLCVPSIAYLAVTSHSSATWQLAWKRWLRAQALNANFLPSIIEENLPIKPGFKKYTYVSSSFFLA
jgi:hypothetical protein